MLDTLSRALAGLGSSASWIPKFVAVVVAVFILYIGIAIWATYRAPDAAAREIRYRIFRDLLDLFRRGRNR